MDEWERAVVVTGAARGIGRATALRLVGGGFRVFAGVRRDSDGEELAAEARRLFGPGAHRAPSTGEPVARPGTRGSLTAVRLDVTSAEDITRAVATVARAVDGRGLYGLVNNAGVVVPAPLEFLPAAELRDQLEVNVVGQHAVTAAFVPLLRAATGRVVMMGSIGDRITAPLTGAYHASKWALAALTHVLRMELRSSGIRVVLVEPGAIATPIWKTAAARGGELEAAMPPDGFHRYSAMIAAARASAARSARAGLPPDVVAATVERALTVACPRTRYLVGRDARLLALVARLPDRLRDRLTLRQATAT